MKIDFPQLKAVLTPITDMVPGLRKESENSLCGPCPKCGGKDRFVYKTDSKRFSCRNCHPAQDDVIKLHMWLTGKTERQLSDEYLPLNGSPSTYQPIKTAQPAPPKKKTTPIPEIWNQIPVRDGDEDVILSLFSDQRGITRKTISDAVKSGIIKLTEIYGKPAAACLFQTLEKEPHQIQYNSIDQTPLLKSNKKSKRIIEGSGIGDDGFFIAGKPFQEASMVVIVESVANALSVVDADSSLCCIAIGSTSYTKKSRLLNSCQEKYIICFLDAGEDKVVGKIAALMDREIYTVIWTGNTPDGYDVNDLLRAGKQDEIRSMIDDAEAVVVRQAAPEAAEHIIDTEQLMDAAQIIEIDATAMEPPKTRFRFIQASDIELKPPEWLIKTLLEKDAIANAFGESEVGKSFLAVDMACSIATGKDFHGKKVSQGPVFYIAGEGQNGIRRRLKAWEIKNDCSLDGEPLFISMTPAAFCDHEQNDFVISAIEECSRECGPPVLIIVDTLARNFGPGDENSTKDMTGFVQSLDLIRARFKSSMLVIHHVGHGDKTRARGSMALKCSLDAEYRFDKKEGGTLQLTPLKMKDAPKPPPMFFEFKVIDLQIVDEDGDRVTSVALESVEYDPDDIQIPQTIGRKKAEGDRQGRVCRAMMDLGGKVQTQSEIIRKLMDNTGSPEGTAKTHVRDAISKGYVVELKDSDFKFELKNGVIVGGEIYEATEQKFEFEVDG